MGSYPTIVNNDNGEQVLVVQTNGYGRYLGNIEMQFDVQSNKLTSWSDSNPILVKNSFPMDHNLKDIVAYYREQVMAKMDTKVGSSLVFVNGGRPKCRLEECSFGNFLTDAMAKEMDVKIAFVNSGSIKGSFAKGTSKHYAISNPLT